MPTPKPAQPIPTGTLDERIPFADAISDDALLARPWKKLSLPQQVVLKAMYGLPLSADVKDKAGWSELDYWSAFQGGGVYDELGYLTAVTQVPYVAKEYDTLTAILGRRSGKSDRIGGFAAAYEITLGGHTSYRGNNKDLFWLYIAQDIATAKTNMKFIVAALQESPLLSKQIAKQGDEEIHFHSGIILRAEPPNIKTARGSAVIGFSADETGFWYKDAKSANPDFEVVVALEYATQQFPHAKQFRFSTPWTREGILWEAHEAGTEGVKFKCEHCATGAVCPHMQEEREPFEGHLVVHAPTAAMGNPLLTRRSMQRRRARNREKFERESLAKFTDSQSSFLTWASVDRSIDRRTKTREKLVGVDYVAALDPAFRRDSFAMTIVHNEKARGIVQDFAKEWVPEPGERLNPAIVLDEVAGILKAWDLTHTFSDQYHLESLMVLAEDRDFTIIGMDLTTKSKAKIMSDLASVVNQSRTRLLDDAVQEKQLKSLQKTLGPQGYVSIAAPSGQHDDRATVLALATSKALELPAADTGHIDPAKRKHQYIDDATLAKLREQWERRMMEDDAFAEQQARMQALLDLYGDE